MYAASEWNPTPPAPAAEEEAVEVQEEQPDEDMDEDSSARMEDGEDANTMYINIMEQEGLPDC